MDIICQFAGGMKPERILYFGPDLEEAKMIQNAYLQAALTVRQGL